MFNAGVAIDATMLRTLPTAEPFGCGRRIGGHLPGQLLAVRSGFAALPEGTTWWHLISTAFLAGVGFTMALVFSGPAFAGTHLEREAQLAILIGSSLAAAVGIGILLTTKAERSLGPE